MTTGQPVVLVFGESLNDARAVACLIEALCPSLKGRVRPRRRPLTLSSRSAHAKVKSWLDTLCDAVIGEKGPVQCIFVHRDADHHDPHLTVMHQLQNQLSAAGIAGAHAVVPVQEIEAWWRLFPEATERVRKSWSGTLNKKPGNVDMIEGPKEKLIERTRSGDRKKAYTEADSPLIAERVAEAIRNGIQPAGNSASYDAFVSSVQTCCSR